MKEWWHHPVFILFCVFLQQNNLGPFNHLLEDHLTEDQSLLRQNQDFWGLRSSQNQEQKKNDKKQVP